MPKIPRAERTLIAMRRLVSVLTAHGAALPRTLEQKISDAGPPGLRIDPHILSPARKSLVSRGRILETEQKRRGADTVWYHLKEIPAQTVAARIAAQEPVYLALQKGDLPKRIGQALEIAVFRALQESKLLFLGSFDDLDQHDDAKAYKKQEPPSSISGHTLPSKMLLDFVVIVNDGLVGIEVKNTREWMYPNRQEIRDLLRKCLAFDAVPVLIARRLPFVTFKIFTQCGVILHQTYQQLLPSTSAALAEQAADKDLLGYHDIRLGNDPDDRLRHFICTNLPALLPEARRRFAAYRDLLEAYGDGTMEYPAFAARVRRRSQGKPEDRDPDPEKDHEFEDEPDDERN